MQKRDKSGRFLNKKSAKKPKKSKTHAQKPNPMKVRLKDGVCLSLWELEDMIEDMVALEVSIQLKRF
jgi:hypothetical protein